MSKPKVGFANAPATPSPTPGEIAAAEAALYKDPRFQHVVAVLANVAAIAKATKIGEKADPVDAGLSMASRELAARLMLVACFSDATPADVAYAQRVIDAAWNAAPILVKEGDRYVAKTVPNAEPWQIALTKVFQVPLFAHHLGLHRPKAVAQRLPTPDPLAAVRDVFKQLALTGVSLPPKLAAAARQLEKPKPLSKIPSPTRDYVEAAVVFLRSLVGKPIGPPADGKREWHVAWENFGGTGKSRKLSPWGAAAEFAAAFRESMPRRMSEAARVKK